MAGEWKKFQLGQLGSVVTGRTPPGTLPEYFGGAVPFVTPSDMDGRRKVHETARSLSVQGTEILKRVIVQRGIAVSCIGWQMGKAVLIDMPAATNQQINTLVPEPELADDLFVYYALTSERDAIFRLGAGGSRTPILNKSGFEAFEITLPPLAEQKAIAAVLGALDDKIELNRRMNATLEVMARALFQSWFVDFDPVRAKLDGRKPIGLDETTAALFPDSFQESSLGHIPKGWEVGRLGQYLATEIGGDWGEDDRFDGAIEVAALRGVDLEHLRERGAANPPRRWIKESSLTKRRMSACDVLVASSGAGPCGRPLWVSPHLEAAFPVPVLYSNFCKRYRVATPAHALYFDRVLFEMRASGEIWDFINGTSIPNLDSNGLMTGKSALVPPVNILKKFAAFVQPIYERLYSRESRTLATLRDTLLPKLLSGELSVTANLLASTKS